MAKQANRNKYVLISSRSNDNDDDDSEIQSKVTDAADAAQKKWLSHSLYNLLINCSKNTDNVSPEFLPFLRDIEIFQDTWTSTNFF